MKRNLSEPNNELSCFIYVQSFVSNQTTICSIHKHLAESKLHSSHACDKNLKNSKSQHLDIIFAFVKANHPCPRALKKQFSHPLLITSQRALLTVTFPLTAVSDSSLDYDTSIYHGPTGRSNFPSREKFMGCAVAAPDRSFVLGDG